MMAPSCGFNCLIAPSRKRFSCAFQTYITNNSTFETSKQATFDISLPQQRTKNAFEVEKVKVDQKIV